MRHFIWIFSFCQSTGFPVYNLKTHQAIHGGPTCTRVLMFYRNYLTSWEKRLKKNNINDTIHSLSEHTQRHYKHALLQNM